MRDILRLPAARVSFILLAVTLAANGLCAALMPLTVIPGPLMDAVIACGGLLVLAVVLDVIRGRLSGDTAWEARAISTFCERAVHACVLLVAILGFGVSAGLLSAFAAAAGAPMQDDTFSRIDVAFGFHWEAFVATLNASPSAVTVLIAAYKSVPYTIGLLVLFFFANGRMRELWEVAALLILGAFATVVISALVPAIGGYTYYGPDPRSTAEFVRQWPQAGTYFVPCLLALHAGLTHTIDLDQVTGLVQFPSFHGILALVLIYAAWPYRWLRWPFAAINAVMIVSTVPVGGHHGADVLGSVAVVIAGVALLDRLEGRAPLWSRIRAFAGNRAQDPAPVPSA